MEDKFMVEIRRRDMLGVPCPFCFDANLRNFGYNSLACPACHKTLPRYLTKAELARLLEQDDTTKREE